jgi:hypothetical protein
MHDGVPTGGEGTIWNNMTIEEVGGKADWARLRSSVAVPHPLRLPHPLGCSCSTTELLCAAVHDKENASSSAPTAMSPAVLQ